MAFTVVFQAGSSLQMLPRNASATLRTLTLPTGIELTDKLPPRWAVFGQYIVMVNSPSKPITIDPKGTVRLLTPAAPTQAPTLSTAAGGSLTGSYTVKQTFIILDEDGNLIAESDFGPASASQSVSGQYLKIATLELSEDTVSGTRFYRTTTGGAVYFQWIDLEGNTQTSLIDDLADAGLSLVSAPVLGTAPDLVLIATHKDRLWGIPRGGDEEIAYCEAGKMYAWPLDNRLAAPNAGLDKRGVTSIIARKEALGFGRSGSLHQLAGTDVNSFRFVTISDRVGVESHESVAIYDDVAYFLARDGVYSWGPNGIQCLSDKNESSGGVRSWFTTDDYFNRALFARAVGQIIPDRKVYRLFLAGVGVPYLNRWIEYSIDDRTWWGPHLTTAFEPVSVSAFDDDHDLRQPVIGSAEGYFFADQDTRSDEDASDEGIALRAESAIFTEGDPDMDKVFLDMSVIGKTQSAGAVTVTPRVGTLDTTGVPGTTLPSLVYDMTKGRARIGRIGRTRQLQLLFEHSTVGQSVELYGYDIPNHDLGRR